MLENVAKECKEKAQTEQEMLKLMEFEGWIITYLSTFLKKYYYENE